jgi:hypothetical protein
MVKRSCEMVRMRGTSVALEEIFRMVSPLRKSGWMLDLMLEREAPTVVEGVVVLRRPEIWRPWVGDVAFVSSFMIVTVNVVKV